MEKSPLLPVTIVIPSGLTLITAPASGAPTSSNIFPETLPFPRD